MECTEYNDVWKNQFQVIGTSSAAIAHSLDYEDGQQIPFSELHYIVGMLLEIIKLTLTVDIENSYGKTTDEFDKIETIGVKRISIWNLINEYIFQTMENTNVNILQKQSFNSLF